MPLNFKQFFNEVEAGRNGGTAGELAPPNEQKITGGFNDIFHPQQHQFSGASYGAARSARQGGETPSTERPERPASFRA
jgi:hypothetical protein